MIFRQPSIQTTHHHHLQIDHYRHHPKRAGICTRAHFKNSPLFGLKWWLSCGSGVGGLWWWLWLAEGGSGGGHQLENHVGEEEVDLWLFDVGVAQDFTLEDELFFNTSCITRMTLSCCQFNPPNGAISWERLKCLCLYCVTLDDHMIEKILSGSPCLEYLELNYCQGFRRIDVSSKSVKKLVFS
ncbi:ribonuclease H-like domain-containing protein [Tanacetum coccineum]